MNTNCKTWECVGCRDRLKALFKARVQTGVYRLGRCAFMTITYAAEGRWRQDAESVKKDWAALWRRLKVHEPWIAEMQYLRVMELTKKGTPHHHLAIGAVPSGRELKCWRRDDFWIDDYCARMDRCPCLAHGVARSWLKVTRDSLIVHTMPVLSARKAGAYMAKYLGKEFDNARAEALGMARRWSSSRGWPGSGRLHLAQTDKGGWDRTTYRDGHVETDIVGGPEDLLERSGDDLTKALAERSAADRFIRKLVKNA